MAQRGRKSAAALALVPHEPATDRTRLELDRPSPPAHLGQPERQIWRDVFSDFSLTARISGAVLATALEAHQRAREARETIAREVVGRAGQGSKVHPLLAVSVMHGRLGCRPSKHWGWSYETKNQSADRRPSRPVGRETHFA